MDECGYGATSERYLGRGVVQLSQVGQHGYAEPLYHLSPPFPKQQQELVERFKHEVCKPWLRENRLEATIALSDWQSRREMGKHEYGEVSFSRWVFREGAISVIGPIAMWQVAKSSNVRGFKKHFGPVTPQQRWWVLELYQHDDAWNPITASESQSMAVCRKLCQVEREGAPLPPYMPSLTPSINQDIRLIVSKPGLTDAFGPLCQIPAMWITKSFNFITDIRKSWCIEEAKNYILRIASQWKEITLSWHPAVVQAVDPETISLVQSRAPLFSSGDRSYLVHAFERKRLFRRLEDSDMRRRVAEVIYRQKFILTLSTFAVDVRLLWLQVRAALPESITGTMKGSQSGIQERVKELFAKEFDFLCRSEGVKEDSAAKERFVADCYRHVFLHALRSAPAHAIRMEKLKALARRVFCTYEGICSDEGVCASDDKEGDIATVMLPGNPLADDPDVEDITGKRHGVSLFNSPAVASRLYLDQISLDHASGFPATQSFLGKYIARTFLYGCAGHPDASVLPSVSLTTVPKSFHFCANDSENVLVENSNSASDRVVSAASTPEAHIDSVLAKRAAEDRTLVSQTCASSPINPQVISKSVPQGLPGFKSPTAVGTASEAASVRWQVGSAAGQDTPPPKKRLRSTNDIEARSLVPSGPLRVRVRDRNRSPGSTSRPVTEWLRNLTPPPASVGLGSSHLASSPHSSSCYSSQCLLSVSDHLRRAASPPRMSVPCRPPHLENSPAVATASRVASVRWESSSITGQSTPRPEKRTDGIENISSVPSRGSRAPLSTYHSSLRSYCASPPYRGSSPNVESPQPSYGVVENVRKAAAHGANDGNLSLQASSVYSRGENSPDSRIMCIPSPMQSYHSMSRAEHVSTNGEHEAAYDTKSGRGPAVRPWALRQPGIVTFISGQSGSRHTAVADRESITQFVNNQTELDSTTTYSYFVRTGRGHVQKHVTPSLLAQTIIRQGLEQVHVESSQLGSTDHKPPR